MNEELKVTISNLTSSDLVVKWLELCGFETLDDIKNINDKVINDIENYVGAVCSLMTIDNRQQYFHGNIFQNYPMQFKFPPSLKCRLLNTVKTLTKKTIQQKIKTLNHKNPSFIKYTMAYLMEIGCVGCSNELHNFIDKYIKDKFQISDDRNLDFNLFQPKVIETNSCKYGFLYCAIDHCGYIEKFFLNEDDTLNIDLIISHMELHFPNFIDSENSKINFEDKSNQSLYFNDLTDAKLCNDLSHDEIIKVAKLKFVNCELVRNIDFNIYEIIGDDLSLTNRGCFVCYLCIKTKAIESKIKFFFTQSRSIVNSNIMAHLRLHFQSVDPSIVIPLRIRNHSLSFRKKNKLSKSIIGQKTIEQICIKMEPKDKENLI